MASRFGALTRMNISSNILRVGAQINLTIGSFKPRRSILSALVVKRNDIDRSIYALFTLNDESSKKIDNGVAYISNRKKEKIGSVVGEKCIFDNDEANVGFTIVRLDELPMFTDLRECLRQVSVSRQISDNIWKHGGIRIRVVNNHLRQLSDTSKFGGRNKFILSYKNTTGKIISEISNVEIVERNRVYKYDYCGLATRKRQKLVVADGEIGSPVIARSGALAGFVVGIYDSMNIVITAEHLSEKYGVTFVTFGDDWPKLLCKKLDEE